MYHTCREGAWNIFGRFSGRGLRKVRICLDPSDQKNITASRPDKMSDQVVHNFPWGIGHIFIFELWFRPTEGGSAHIPGLA